MERFFMREMQGESAEHGGESHAGKERVTIHFIEQLLLNWTARSVVTS
jgi:hypothetical protein